MTIQAISLVNTLHEAFVALDGMARDKRQPAANSVSLFKTLLLVTGPIITNDPGQGRLITMFRDAEDPRPHMDPNSSLAYFLGERPFGFVTKDENGNRAITIATLIGDPIVAVTTDIEQWVTDGLIDPSSDSSTPGHLVFARAALEECLAILRQPVH